MWSAIRLLVYVTNAAFFPGSKFDLVVDGVSVTSLTCDGDEMDISFIEIFANDF